jgi:hypothetical protein
MRHPAAPNPIPHSRQIDWRKFGYAPFFRGNDYGAFFGTLGRGGKGLLAPWRILEGALLYQPALPVQVLGLGTPQSGSYPSQPLAVPPSTGTSASI